RRVYAYQSGCHLRSRGQHLDHGTGAQGLEIYWGFAVNCVGKRRLSDRKQTYKTNARTQSHDYDVVYGEFEGQGGFRRRGRLDAASERIGADMRCEGRSQLRNL